jgi:CDP-glucose 4,6-dehydratase
MFNSCYNGKKVLITGHTGFKGSWLSLWLKEMGAEVIGYSLDPYTENDFYVKTSLSDKITDLRGNILYLDHMKEIFHDFQPDFVFHLAAQPIVRLSYDDPVGTFQANVMGTMNILEAMRSTYSVLGSILITTDKVYANRETIWGYREDDALGGYDPYSASKACAEIVIDSYRKSFFSKKTEENLSFVPAAIASVRAGNVLGGGDWQTDRLIPDCFRSLQQGQPINIRNPTAVRPWQHVLDALGGYLLLGEKLLTSEKANYIGAWNFGPLFDSLTNVETVVQKILAIWNGGEYVINSPSFHEIKHEAQLLSLDITKAIAKLGWAPILSLDDCLLMTVDWYKYAYDNPTENMYDFSVNQIKKFCQIAIEKDKNWMNFVK